MPDRLLDVNGQFLRLPRGAQIRKGLAREDLPSDIHSQVQRIEVMVLCQNLVCRVRPSLSLVTEKRVATPPIPGIDQLGGVQLLAEILRYFGVEVEHRARHELELIGKPLLPARTVLSHLRSLIPRSLREFPQDKHPRKPGRPIVVLVGVVFPRLPRLIQGAVFLHQEPGVEFPQILQLFPLH